MSTEHVVIEGDRIRVVLDERSSLFDLDFDDEVHGDRFTIKPKMTSLEVVDMAMRLLQPTLYNVSDPKLFMENVIKPALEKLYV